MYKITLVLDAQDELTIKKAGSSHIALLTDNAVIALNREQMELLIEKMREMMDYKNES